MTKQEIVTKVKSLGLPKASYVVYGSGPLAVAGIRDANDVDLLVTPQLYDDLKKQGWQQKVKGDKDEPVVFDVFEAHQNWDFSPYSPTLKQLLKTATLSDGVPFASVEEVRKWKAASTKSKHQQDIVLIDKYLAKF